MRSRRPSNGLSPTTQRCRGIICLCAVIVLLLSSCGKEEEKAVKPEVVRPVKIMTLTSGAAELSRALPGVVRATQRVDLAFQVPGRLIELPIQEGQDVKQGQLLARLDPKDFDSNLRTAEGQMAKAQASLEYSRTEYQRYQRIRDADPGAVSEAMISQRRARVDVAQADIQSAKAAVQLAKDQLSYTKLFAPFEGVVAVRYVDNFRYLQAKERVLSLQKISDIEILVDLPEMDVAVVRKGTAKLHAEFAAAPGKRFELKVKEFAKEADPKTQTYRLVLEMPAPKEIRVLPGMTATVSAEIRLAEEEKKMTIPAVAVLADDQGNPGVWVVEKDKMTVHRRKVTTGNLTGKDSIEILSGLQPGEMIAVSGVGQLREGMKVRAFDGKF